MSAANEGENDSEPEAEMEQDAEQERAERFERAEMESADNECYELLMIFSSASIACSRVRVGSGFMFVSLLFGNAASTMSRASTSPNSTRQATTISLGEV